LKISWQVNIIIGPLKVEGMRLKEEFSAQSAPVMEISFMVIQSDGGGGSSTL